MFRSRIFPPRYFLKDFNHGYRTAFLKKSFSWLLPLFMAVANYYYNENGHRMMRTTIISHFLKYVVEISTWKNYRLVTLYFLFLLITSQNVVFFYIFNMVSVLLIQLQAFDSCVWQHSYLTVVSHNTARAFTMSNATQAAAFDRSKVSDRVWHTDLLHKLRSYGITGWVLTYLVISL